MKYLYLLLAAFVFTFSSCGAHARHELGIPAAKSESFYFHMKQAALDSGYDVAQRDEDGSLIIYTPEGSLHYTENGDGMEVAMHTKDREDDSEEEALLQQLEKTHSMLLEKAKALAKTNQAW